jgi:glycosyltransferase involved in cell wall biosynthesis/GT2 family glycosyltransferase
MWGTRIVSAPSEKQAWGTRFGGYGMRVAVVQSEARPDGAALAMARAWRARGHAVTLVVPQVGLRPVTPGMGDRWRAEGFAWVPVGASRLVHAEENFPRYPSLATARALAGVLETFDAVWFGEHYWAAPMLRARRFRERALPVVVLGGEEAGAIPSTMEEINVASAVTYAERWADRVLRDAASLDAEIEAVEAMVSARLDAPAVTLAVPQSSPAVTVCMPYYEAPEFLLPALASLERQTSTEFTVIVVDDGSVSDEARRAFAECEQRYARLGWRFLQQANASPGAARNHAARSAATEFLLFLDCDDIAMPTMVERFLRAALLTGDDCLVVPNYGFRDDPEGPVTVLYDPPGNDLIGSMGDDMHGGSCMLVRRSAFEAIGGFTAERGVGFEDYELHVRFNLQGMRWDVLPELLYRYRMPRAKNVSRSTIPYANHAGVLRWYAQQLQPFGMEQMPVAFASVYREHQRVKEKLGELQRAMRWRLPKRHPRGKEVKLLLLTCNFPYGVDSGWHMRVREMIRYFGSRYELTLMTSMPREELASVRREAFRYLHVVRGVEGSDTTVAMDEDLPFRVRQHTTDRMQAALQAMPTEQYHAALLDQIFLGELRREIDTKHVLTEHNLESRLLRQAAEREWVGTLPEAYRNPLLEAERMERYEERVWPAFALRAVVSEVDRAEMERRAPGGRTVVAPNGADPSTWIAGARFDTKTVLFAGHLAYLPNVDAVEFLLKEIWPKVLARVPEARLIVAGRDPADGLRVTVAKARGVELCASPASMQKVAARASLTVAPLRLGSGTRVKILESLAWGLPVVSTAIGAEGIDAVDGEHLLIGDDPAAFTEAMVRLLSDEALWGRLRAEGRVLIRTRYAWDRVFAPFEKALMELIS